MGPLGDVPPSEQLMTVARADRAGCAVLVVQGDVDLSTGDRLTEAAEDALVAAGSAPVVLDLSAVDFLSSSGLGLLVALDERATALGSALRVVAGRTPPVIRPIRTLGLDDTLALFDTLDEALHG